MPPSPPTSPTAAPPWARSGDLSRLAFATIWSTGADPARDGIFRLRALRRDPAQGEDEELDLFLSPFSGGSEGRDDVHRATQRMANEFGVHSGDLDGAPSLDEVREEFERFLSGRAVLVPDARLFSAWFENAPFTVVDLPAIAALLLPGRLASLGERLADELTSIGEGPPGPITPERLRDALGILVGRALDRPPAVLSLLAHALADAVDGLESLEDRAAGELRLAAGLLEHPSIWRGKRSQLYPEHNALTDGQLSDAVRLHDTLEDALEAGFPRWAQGEEREPPQLSPAGEEPAPLDASDRRAIDEIFQVHLPRLFAERDARNEGPEGHRFRPGQHEVAARIAERFGHKEFLLVHAPTGTGKTLAYLVPALLFAVRNELRVGVATYTRALQEQALARDVPLALACLKRIGAPPPRVSVLKGRSNYLCWRALSNQLPPPEAHPAELLAWLSLALFATSEPDGDLDRFSPRAPFGIPERGDAWRRRMEQLIRLVRAETGCCSQASDRATCGAHAARRRAERSHLVLTNHAFTLARREFFRYVIFDECEHLHDVAREAFSHSVSVRALRELLDRVHRTRQGRTRSVLGRLLDIVLDGSGASTVAQEGVEIGRRARWIVDEFSDALVRFKDWRAARARHGRDEDSYALFREYLGCDESGDLLTAHTRLAIALNDLGACLQRLAEHLDESPGRHSRRIRRRLDLLRSDLEDAREAVEAWIPRAGESIDGPPLLRETSFHDLETNARGDDVLAARVLLPHEHLGRHYYPDLSSAVFLSATTWLAGGFDAASAYLGLTRAAHPIEGEEREPSILSTFRAPEAFDYSRVLVAVPRDAPSIREDKRAFLRYTARFVGYLAERTRGRMLVLFTNAEDLATVAADLEPFFAARSLPFWYQRMRGNSKEELAELFRSQTDSILFGLDTFWYGTDFPGATLEYVVLVRLPYGVPDPYHRAQCAALGTSGQRREIYMPRALAKFRQGFGRLMRRESDRGCVFVLDKRIIDPRHRAFLRELPVRSVFEADGENAERCSDLVIGDTDRCISAATAHMSMGADVRRRGLDRPFRGWTPVDDASENAPRTLGRSSPVLEIPPERAPF